MARYSVDWWFFAQTVGLLLAPLFVYISPLDPRLVGWTLAAVAIGVMMYRLLGWFFVTPTGMRMFAVVQIISLIISAWAQWIYIGDETVPFTVPTYLMISQRLMCIGLGLYWVRWIDTNVSPFVKARH